MSLSEHQLRERLIQKDHHMVVCFCAVKSSTIEERWKQHVQQWMKSILPPKTSISCKITYIVTKDLSKIAKTHTPKTTYVGWFCGMYSLPLDSQTLANWIYRVLYYFTDSYSEKTIENIEFPVCNFPVTKTNVSFFLLQYTTPFFVLLKYLRDTLAEYREQKSQLLSFLRQETRFQYTWMFVHYANFDQVVHYVITVLDYLLQYSFKKGTTIYRFVQFLRHLILHFSCMDPQDHLSHFTTSSSISSQEYRKIQNMKKQIRRENRLSLTQIKQIYEQWAGEWKSVLKKDNPPTFLQSFMEEILTSLSVEIKNGFAQLQKKEENTQLMFVDYSNLLFENWKAFNIHMKSRNTNESTFQWKYGKGYTRRDWILYTKSFLLQKPKTSSSPASISFFGIPLQMNTRGMIQKIYKRLIFVSSPIQNTPSKFSQHQKRQYEEIESFRQELQTLFPILHSLRLSPAATLLNVLHIQFIHVQSYRLERKNSSRNVEEDIITVFLIPSLTTKQIQSYVPFLQRHVSEWTASQQQDVSIPTTQIIAQKIQQQQSPKVSSQKLSNEDFFKMLQQNIKVLPWWKRIWNKLTRKYTSLRKTLLQVGNQLDHLKVGKKIYFVKSQQQKNKLLAQWRQMKQQQKKTKSDKDQNSGKKDKKPSPLPLQEKRQIKKQIKADVKDFEEACQDLLSHLFHLPSFTTQGRDKIFSIRQPQPVKQGNQWKQTEISLKDKLRFYDGFSKEKQEWDLWAEAWEVKKKKVLDMIENLLLKRMSNRQKKNPKKILYSFLKILLFHTKGTLNPYFKTEDKSTDFSKRVLLKDFEKIVDVIRDLTHMSSSANVGQFQQNLKDVVLSTSFE